MEMTMIMILTLSASVWRAVVWLCLHTVHNLLHNVMVVMMLTMITMKMMLTITMLVVSVSVWQAVVWLHLRHRPGGLRGDVLLAEPDECDWRVCWSHHLRPRLLPPAHGLPLLRLRPSVLTVSPPPSLCAEGPPSFCPCNESFSFCPYSESLSFLSLQ